jgi:hypothetical protein
MVAEHLATAFSAAHCRRVGRNHPCHCGSGLKYKRCCLERDSSARRRECAEALPPWTINSRGKLQQFEKYACKVFDLPGLLGSLSDGRRDPDIPTYPVVNSLFHAALLRLPSINALEADLKEADFLKLIGLKANQGTKAFSAEVIDNVLDKLDLDGPSACIEEVIWNAERNKAFRDDTYGTLRCVAIDGWEPFASYDRHCPHCLVRKVKVKRADGQVEEVDQYYHRYVVAVLVAPLLDLVLGIEPVRNGEARRDAGEDAHHEGELTAAHRLIDSLHEAYGTFIDAFVLDALYANGPVMTKLDKYNYGGFIVLKKETDEPLKEANNLWARQPPCRSFDDRETSEHIDFWDVDGLETLSTYKGKVRVIRAKVTKSNGKRNTWCFGLVGDRVRSSGLCPALKTIRARWHIENTAFNQWVQYWNLSHVYHHTNNALLAVLLLWSLVFNLLQLFVYRRLKRQRNPKDPSDTIRHIVEMMLRDLGTIPTPIPWATLVDSS